MRLLNCPFLFRKKKSTSCPKEKLKFEGKKINFNSRAFIGPIGDDLPSLIPIIFSLLIFFSSFSFTFSKFNQENELIDVKLKTLNLARTMKVNSLIDSPEHFKQLCEEAKVIQINFIVGLVDLDKVEGEEGTTSPPFLKVPKEEGFGGEEEFFTCYSQGFDEADPEERKIPTDKQVLNLTYPIALQHENVVIPTHLVIRAWK